MSDEQPSGEGSWKDSLPEGLRDAPYFKNAESPDQVLADLTNAAAWQGNSMRIPGPDAPPEQRMEVAQKAMEKMPELMLTPNREDPERMDALWKQMGRPESPDGYQAPEGADLADLKAFAHQANLTAEQFQTLADNMVTNQNQSMEKAQLELQSQYQTLSQEWGAAYDQNMQDIGKLLSNAPDSVKQAYESKTLPADQLRWLHEISQLGSESAQVPGQAEAAPRIMNPDDARAQLGEIEARLFDVNCPPEERQLLNAKRRKLIGLAHGMTELPPMAVVES